MIIHLAFCGGRRPIPNHPGGTVSQHQALGRLPQKQDPGRDHLYVSTILGCFHTVPERKAHLEQHSDDLLAEFPETHTPLGSPADSAPQHGTQH